MLNGEVCPFPETVLRARCKDTLPIDKPCYTCLRYECPHNPSMLSDVKAEIYFGRPRDFRDVK
jgi:hypothetical protein